MLLQEEPIIKDQLVEILNETKLDKQNTITQERMLGYWRDTMEFIESLQGSEKEERIKLLSLPFSSIVREKPRVVKRVINEQKMQSHVVIDSLDKVGEMIKDIKSFTIESGYNGPDSHTVKLIKGILPIEYENRISLIKLKHLPIQLDREGRIFVGRSIDENNNVVVNYYCNALSAVYSGKDLNWYFNRRKEVTKIKAEDLEIYHCISFKVSIYNDEENGIENGIIKSWDVGIDKDSQVIFDDNEKFVMLGYPRSK